MTRKEENKILDNKIESNVNQYKVDRLNAEISAFSSGDLNKYEFLTRKDLKYKPSITILSHKQQIKRSFVLLIIIMFLEKS